MESEQKELIRVKFTLPWETDQEKDEILNKLKSLYLADPSLYRNNEDDKKIVE